MEDSAFNKLTNLEEQLSAKNKELIAANKKERKKKELEDLFDKQKLDRVSRLILLLKKSYPDMTLN